MRGTAFLLIVLTVFGSFASAAVLDWGVVDWAGGSLSNTYLNVDGVGVDISLAFTGDTGEILTSHGSTPGPLPTDLHTWDASGLWWAANFSQASQSLTLTISFDSAVSNVSFKVHDLDGTGVVGGSGNWETLTVSGTLAGNAVNALLTPGSHQVLNGNTIQSNGWDQTPADPTTTALIQFNNVDTIVLLYKSNINSERGEILSNITFVPEPSTMLLLAAGVMGLLRKRSKK